MIEGELQFVFLLMDFLVLECVFRGVVGIDA